MASQGYTASSSTPCTPFTDPVDLSWYSAAELNKNCCEQKSLCCTVNAEGDVDARSFFQHGAGASGSPTLSQARASCGVTGTADEAAGRYDAAPQTTVTTRPTRNDPHHKTHGTPVAGGRVQAGPHPSRPARTSPR